MKKFLRFLMVALVLTFAPVIANAAPVVGETAPNFTATDSAGKTHKLSDLKGKVVVLEWTNDACPFVQKHYESGNMQALQEKAKADDVVWLSIISSAEGKQGYVTGKKADALTKTRNAHPAAVLIDKSGDVGRLYDAKTTPHMFVIDKKGSLVYAGAIDSIPSADKEDVSKATNYVTAALDSLKSGTPVEMPSTKSYGCGVKYAN